MMAVRRQKITHDQARSQSTAKRDAIEREPLEAQPLILLRRISQLVTMRREQGSTAAKLEGPRRGRQMREICLLKDAAVLIAGERIVAVGTGRQVERNPLLRERRSGVMELDCRGLVVLPGFVDSHTHPAFLSPRLGDFAQRIAGATYEQIAAHPTSAKSGQMWGPSAGGGIRSSVAEVRAASEAKLADHVYAALRQAESQGTTTLEAKSGYGLDAASELKSLKAIRRAAEQWDGAVVATFLGAHIVPPEFEKKPERYVDLLCRELLPAVARRRLAEFVDVCCERGAFTLAQTERILREAQRCNLRTRLHAGQWTRTPLASLLHPSAPNKRRAGNPVQFHPASIDHLDHMERDDIRVLGASETIATLLPGANYFLGAKTYPPARRLIDAGAAVALATDYNPGSSPTLSMPTVLSLACTQMRMSPEEALTAATINGAWALGLGGRKGSIEPGKDADLAFFALDDYRELPYWFGGNHCVAVMMRGRLSELF